MQDHIDFGTISGEVLPDTSCNILQSPSQKVMQDLSGMVSPDIVPKSVMILHARLERSWILLFQDLARILSWA